jgi:hypothetical protein
VTIHTKRQTQSIQATSRTLHFSTFWLLAIVLAPLAITSLLTVFSLPVFYDLHPYFWGESKLVENLQFPAFLFAGILGLTLAWRTWIRKEKTWISLFYVLFGLGLIFIAGEEVAWGQQFLGFRTPEFVQSFNVQNEFTLHNFSALQDHTDFLNLIFGIAGLIGIQLGAYRQLKRVSIDSSLTSWFSLILILGAFGVGFDLFLDGRPLNYPAEYPFHIQTETAELLIGMGSALYLWLNLRKFAPNLPRTIRLQRVKVREKFLEMQTPDGLLITSPINKIPWLEKADLSQRQNLHLTKGGTSIHWLDLGVERKVSQLLKTPTAPLTPTDIRLPSFKRTQVLIPIAAGLISIVWLVLIPGDPQNAVLLGLSKTRLLMLAVGLGLWGWMGSLYLRGLRDPVWRKMMSQRIYQIYLQPAPLTGIVWAAAVGVLGSTAALTAAYAHPDPYIKGIINRLAPFAFWVLVIALEAFLLAFPRLVAASRNQLTHISNLRIIEDQLTLKTSSQIEITTPISQYPALAQASQDQQAAFNLTCGATRVEWPVLGIEIQFQHLLHNSHRKK